MIYYDSDNEQAKSTTLTANNESTKANNESTKANNESTKANNESTKANNESTKANNYHIKTKRGRSTKTNKDISSTAGGLKELNKELNKTIILPAGLTIPVVGGFRKLETPIEVKVFQLFILREAARASAAAAAQSIADLDLVMSAEG